MSKNLSWTLLAVSIAVTSEVTRFGADVRSLLPDALAGFALLGAGVIGLAGRHQLASARLTYLAAAAWFAANFVRTGVHPLDWIGLHLQHLHRALIVHAAVALLGAPRRSRLRRVALATLYASTLATTTTVGVWALMLGAGATIVLVTLQQRVPVNPNRRRIALLVPVVLVGTLLLAFAMRSAYSRASVDGAALLAYEGVIAMISVALALALAGDALEPRLEDLVIDLADGPSGMREALASAVGDAQLDVAFASSRSGQFIDSTGRPLKVPAASAASVATPVVDDGVTVAVLLHDRALLDNPALTSRMARAARLASASARLQEDLRAQRALIEASQQRLVSVSADQLAILEPRVRERVVEPLTQLVVRLEAIAAEAPGLDDALADLRLTTTDLARFVAGTRPRGGRPLAAALEHVVSGSPIRITLTLSIDVLPDAVADTLYFVCGEALANTLKHADAESVSISVEQVATGVSLRFSDDGRGGADATAGEGLAGMAERVAALGGSLALSNPTGGGTEIVVRVPLTLNG